MKLNLLFTSIEFDILFFEGKVVIDLKAGSNKSSFDKVSTFILFLVFATISYKLSIVLVISELRRLSRYLTYMSF